MGRWSKIFWGLGLVLIAVALILDGIGVLGDIIGPFGEVSIFAALGGLMLVSFMLSRIIKGEIDDIFIPLAIIFIIFEKNIATVLKLENEDIISNWLVICCAVLLKIGFGILLSSVKRTRLKIEIDDEGCKVNRGNLTSSVRYIDCDGFVREIIENNLGSFTIHFENTEKYEGGAILEIENNLGSMTINIPKGWNIVTDIDNSLGSTSVPAESYPDGPVIRIDGENNLGSIKIKYV